MSYDIRLEIDTGGECPAYVTDCFCPTYNLGPMFSLALGHGLRGLDGKTGEECKEPLRKAIAAMQDNPAPYKDLEPENGWGDYDGAVNALQQLLGYCCEHPKATVRI